MKFLILLACIAATSAYSSYLPYGGGYGGFGGGHNSGVYGGFGGYHGGYPGYGITYHGSEQWTQNNKKNCKVHGGDYYQSAHYPTTYGAHYPSTYGAQYPTTYDHESIGGDYQNFDFQQFLGQKDITVVKRDFILFYHKYLLEILDILKTRFGDVLVHADTFNFDSFHLPMKCTKLNGAIRWMMMANIDVTKRDVHLFDTFMMCKLVDYVMFIKNYFLHFDMDIMYRDYGLIRNLYGMIGGHNYGLYKYYGDVFGHDFKYGTGVGLVKPDLVGKIYADKMYNKDFINY